MVWLSPVGITIIILTLFIAPLATEAQQHMKVARIGVLDLGPSPSEAQLQQSPFWQKLRELGWHEGQNLTVERRYAERQRDRLPALAADLVQLKPDLIFAQSTWAGLAAKEATATIPIVLFGAGLPVETGLVHSLAQPGGNVTGVAIQTGPEDSGKRLQLLKEAAPWILQVGIFWDPDFPMGTSLRQQVQADAEALGLTPHFLEDSASSGLEQLVATITQNRLDALYLTGGTFSTSHERDIAALAVTHRLPTISYRPAYVRAGGLMSDRKSTRLNSSHLGI